MTNALAQIPWRTLAFRGMRCVVIAWVILFAVVYLGQRKLMYMPFAADIALKTLALDRVTATTLDTPDGEHLTVWRAPSEPGKPTILYFHGNGGSLAHRAHSFRQFRDQGFGLYAMSYRGFTGSTGNPSEAANVADAKLAYDQLRATGTPASDIVIYGESLGTGVAVQVAAERAAAAVILEAPYSSVTDIAAGMYWYFPVRKVIWDQYRSTDHVRNVTAPLLIVHGTRDEIIPVEFARQLAAAAVEPKRFVEYPDGHHLDLYGHGAFDAVKAWIAEHHNRLPAATH